MLAVGLGAPILCVDLVTVLIRFLSIGLHRLDKYGQEDPH